MLPKRIAVTGAAGYLGGALVEALLRDAAVERVIAIDVAAGGVPTSPRLLKVQWDVRDPMRAILAESGAQAIVHLAYPMRHQRSFDDVRPYAEDSTRHVLDAARDLELERVVLCSSTTVYGARPGQPRPATEDTPRQPNRGYHYAVGKDVMERTAEQHPRWGRGVAMLRPCLVVGPNADNYLFGRFFGTEVVIRGTDPALQLLHESDFADATVAILRGSFTGPINLAPADWIRRSQLFSLFQIEAEETSREDLHERLERRWNEAPEDPQSVQPSMIDLLNYSWLADNGRLREQVGYSPSFSSLDALLSLFKAFRKRWKREGPILGAFA